MQLKIQKNNSEKIAINKDITDVLTLNGTLKENTSIINPVIMVEGDLSLLADVNYLTIPEFKRSYFINNITSIRNGLIQISAHVDVLSSFKKEILANNAIIEASEKNWNLYLNDGSIHAYQNPEIVTKRFGTGFTQGKSFILVVSGG